MNHGSSNLWFIVPQQRIAFATKTPKVEVATVKFITQADVERNLKDQTIKMQLDVKLHKYTNYALFFHSLTSASSLCGTKR